VEFDYLENEAFKAKLPTLLQSKDRPSAFHSWGGGVMYEEVSSGICQDITKAASEGGFKDTFYSATIQTLPWMVKFTDCRTTSRHSSSGTIKSCARKPENKHYGGKMSDPVMPPNGLRPDQAAKEGNDQFIQEDRYFSTYATYFARFVQDYTSQGIDIGTVMPQNEFNSAQPFPSCCWTAEGLARFISFLGPEIQKLNVDVFFGTLERPNEKLVDVTLLDPRATKYIQGVEVQWAGKRPFPA
jgi:O-glycosyl hydrolase